MMYVEHRWTLTGAEFDACDSAIVLPEVRVLLETSFDGSELHRCSLEADVDRDILKALARQDLFELGSDTELDKFDGDEPIALRVVMDSDTRERLAPAYAAHKKPVGLFDIEIHGECPARQLANYQVRAIRQVSGLSTSW